MLKASAYLHQISCLFKVIFGFLFVFKSIALFAHDKQSCSVEGYKLFDSPQKKVRLGLCLDDGTLFYDLVFDGKIVVERSRLGLSVKDGPDFTQNLNYIEATQSLHETRWEQVWGEEQVVHDHHNRVSVKFDKDHHDFFVEFRVFDNGVGFRYVVPKLKKKNSLLLEEVTEFKLPKNAQMWWIPALNNKVYENIYTKSPVKDLNLIHTPATAELNKAYISIHEAAVVDFPTMVLQKKDHQTLKVELVPWGDGTLAKLGSQFLSPWRTLKVASNPGDLITNYIDLNLNEPNKIKDTTWIRPMKFIGIWWALHTGRGSWAEKYPDLAATTENSMKYIDHAKKLSIPGLLIEGWNKGWDEPKFSYLKPNSKFDLKKVAQYAQKNNVAIIGHHETNGMVTNYEKELDAAFALYAKHGIHTVKTGYVGDRVEGGEYHYGQKMVRHHDLVVKKAIEHKIMLNIHEPVKDTGLRRTYPNLMTREGVRGTEYDAWSHADGNPPSHTTVLPFTRGLSGPMDFTPGIFDLNLQGKRGLNRIRTTLAKQLALFVVLYSPHQMAADLPEFYFSHPAFQFIKDVPVDWNTTKVLNASIGEFVTIVRKDKHSQDWYLGSITNEMAKSFKIKLDFLDPQKKYLAQIYRDQTSSHWQTNAEAYEIVAQDVQSKTILDIKLSPGGGQAIRFKAL